MNCFIPFAYEPGYACKRNRALQGRLVASTKIRKLELSRAFLF